jgi:protein involved in polysaccharide export with SLBB domain
MKKGSVPRAWLPGVLMLLWTLTAPAGEDANLARQGVSVKANTANAAAWCDQYTIGPGDVYDLGIYGHPELKREKVAVQPDGNLTYLQATNIHADGLTIDQLRHRLQDILVHNYTMPLVLVSPVALRSKKYYIIGKVVANGSYIMDRPMTLLEAVAKAQGLETGLVEHRNAELADLSRSFLVRHGQRVTVNFEALFLKGDLSQNVQMEPGDYIYVALARTADINVFGEVTRPGVQAYSAHLGVVDAITARGGFTPAAFRERVLIVRGSLSHPQAIVLNTNDVLKGLVPDREVEPGDIVYVSARPWKFAEDLLDTAVTAFLQATVTTYTGQNVPNLINRTLLPQSGLNN